MSNPILSVENLNKIYPNGVQALKDVSFKVEKGEFLVIIGLSGSGKSTLLRCLNRLVDPSSGKIFFEGRDVAEITDGKEIRGLRQKIGMIFQHFNLVPRYSVLANVLVGRLGFINNLRSIFRMFSPVDRKKALDYLNLMGISSQAHLRADQLSGGQQQRVAIARTLTQEPSVILADEPVANLDPATSHVVLDQLKKVNTEMGLTVICNLHYLNLVREYATRVIALKEGKIVFEGKPEQIDESWFKKIYGEEAREFRGNSPGGVQR